MTIHNGRAESREDIFTAIRRAAPGPAADIADIRDEAKELLDASIHARPPLLADNALDAMVKRIDKGLVIGTSCERIESLANLPGAVANFLERHSLDKALQVQKTQRLRELDWREFTIDVDIEKDMAVGLCWAEYGIAETGSFVVHSKQDMPILLNFLPFYLLAILPRSKILSYMDDYALIANEIAERGETPHNMCIISGVSGTTDIEGVLVQGAHGPEVLHLIIVDSL